ncbi:hypothetical protein FO519_000030 [Halicephalobus sp. NKZ332]|nr:hypothetical protein FO519_000030 [Halicephalobus sp. NKZ332]
MSMMLFRLFFVFFGLLLIAQKIEGDAGGLSHKAQEDLKTCMTELVQRYDVDDVRDYSNYSSAVNNLASKGWNKFYGTFCYNEAMFFGCLSQANLNSSVIDKFTFMSLFEIDFEAAVGYVNDYYMANYLCGSGNSDASQAFDCVYNLNVVGSSCYMSEYNCWTLAKYQDCMSTNVYGQTCGMYGKILSCNFQNIKTTIKMGLFEVFTAELMAFSVFFTFLPAVLVKDWYNRGTAEGFSSVNFVLPMLMMGCWYRHGLMTSDSVNIYLNGFNLVVYTFYVLAFAYYQPKRRYLIGQLVSLFIAYYSLFTYVDTETNDLKRNELMSAMAAGTQVFSLIGGIYEIKRAIDLKTTEYLPATIQFGIFLLIIQWSLFAYIIGNYHMMGANIAALVVNIVTIGLYFVYPPLTWTVPIFGIKPQKKKDFVFFTSVPKDFGYVLPCRDLGCD